MIGLIIIDLVNSEITTYEVTDIVSNSYVGKKSNELTDDDIKKLIIMFGHKLDNIQYFTTCDKVFVTEISEEDAFDGLPF